MADSSFGLKIGLEGEREFKRAIREINREMRVLGSEMKLASSQFAKNETSVPHSRRRTRFWPRRSKPNTSGMPTTARNSMNRFVMSYSGATASNACTPTAQPNPASPTATMPGLPSYTTPPSTRMAALSSPSKTAPPTAPNRLVPSHLIVHLHGEALCCRAADQNGTQAAPRILHPLQPEVHQPRRLQPSGSLNIRLRAEGTSTPRQAVRPTPTRRRTVWIR